MTTALTVPQQQLLNRLLLAGDAGLVLNDRARSRLTALEAAGLVTVDWDMRAQAKGSGIELTGRNAARARVAGSGTPGDPLLLDQGVLDLSELRAHVAELHRRQPVPRSNRDLASWHAWQHHRYRPRSHIHEGPWTLILRGSRRPAGISPAPLGWFTGQLAVTREELDRRLRERLSGRPENQPGNRGEPVSQEELDRRAEQAFESRYQVARGPFADNDLPARTSGAGKSLRTGDRSWQSQPWAASSPGTTRTARTRSPRSP